MTDNLPTTTERPRISATAMTMETTRRGSVPMPVSFGEVIALADVMSRSQHAIPKHLRDNPGACLAVTMQAMRWEMDPFAVASKTYSVKDQVAYEAQVIAAVVNTRSGLMRRPSIDFTGEGATRQCIIRGEFLDGANAEYVSPEIGKITTKNSPLWNSDPDQQLAYFSLRSFARRHCPEVILGVYDRDEIIESEVRDVTPAGGTGLLAKLQSTTDNIATEGFGIRDLNAEAGEPAPAAEPKKRERKKSAATEALEQAGAEIASEAAMNQGDQPAIPATEEQLADFDADEEAAEAAEKAENLPADAQVEPEAATEPETAPSRLETVYEYPAPAGVRYFLADKPAFPSGRRVVYVDGQSEKEAVDDTPVIPTYTAHPVAPTEAEMAPVEPERPATTKKQDGAEPRTALDDFLDTVATARDAAELVAALRELFADPDHKTPEAKRRPRQVVWETVAGWNADGAGVDPVSDPFLLACYIETETDPDAVEQTLPLAREQEWFKAGGEPMQAGVARAINDRVAVLRAG